MALSWLFSLGWLGDAIDVEKLRIGSDYRRIHDLGMRIAGEISDDSTLYSAVIALASVIDASFDSQIDINQALDLLEELWALIDAKLPDSDNIKHDGYKIISWSALHRVRCSIYDRAKFKRGLNKQDLSRVWYDLIAKAKAIQNTADRVYVITLVAKDVAHFNYERAKSLLEEAGHGIDEIPTFLDRADRLETLSDAWVSLGEKTKAQFAIETAAKLVDQLKDTTADQLLESLVQAAYRVSPGLADELVSRFGSRLPEPALSPARIALETHKLVDQPATISRERDIVPVQDFILGYAARKLRDDLIAGRAPAIPAQSTLEEWLMVCSSLSPSAFFDVARWVLESLSPRHSRSSTGIKLDTILDAVNLIYDVAKWISPAKREGVPDAMQDAFPGLGSQIEVFRPSEEIRARKWLQRWLSENVSEYLKICDPYFDLEQLDYLQYIPSDCKVLVVTTDEYIRIENDPEMAKKRIEMEWRKISSRPLPRIQFVIVPRGMEAQFHDRLVITAKTGLDIGQSLNGLGKKYGKISVLSEKDAKKLERDYVDTMLNQGAWFMNHGLTPHIIFLAGDA